MSQAGSFEHLWPVLHNADKSYFLSCAATALALYEHTITIQSEIQHIWRRDSSAATVLFVMTRYLLLLDRVFVTLALYPIRDLGSCSALLWLQAVTSSSLITVMSAIAAIRVYALWNGDLRLLTFVMLTGLFPAIANLFFRGASSAYIVPARFYSCQLAPTAMTVRSYTALALATRIISIVSDGVVVVLTWVKTFKVYALARRARFRADCSLPILRDGAIYFLATCVLNFVAIVYILWTGTNVLNDLVVTLSAILMSRFLLNLRDRRARLEEKAYPWQDNESSSLATRTRPLSSIQFASGVLDTMGGTVRMRSDGEDSDNEENCEDSEAHIEHTQGSRRSSSDETVDDAVKWA